MKVIFTDLDGTLLDDRYRCDEAIPLIDRLKRDGISIVFVSAKTVFEQEVFRNKLGIGDPFIVEDGSAIYIPFNYFGKRVGQIRRGYESLVLGVNREIILDKIKSIGLKCYANMSAEEIADLTGLSLEMAEMAKKREFSEIVVEADDEALKILSERFKVVLGGRFYHICGKSVDKGKAVRILSSLYRDVYGDVITIGIGNSHSDLPMLREVDIPALVRNSDGWIDVNFKVYKAKGMATEGWIEVVERFVG